MDRISPATAWSTYGEGGKGGRRERGCDYHVTDVGREGGGGGQLILSCNKQLIVKTNQVIVDPRDVLDRCMHGKCQALFYFCHTLLKYFHF